MQLRFEENPPTTRTTGITWTSIERTQVLSYDRSSTCMRRRRPGRCDQLSINDLCDQEIRDLKQIFVGSSMPRWVHIVTLAWSVSTGKEFLQRKKNLSF